MANQFIYRNSSGLKLVYRDVGGGVFRFIYRNVSELPTYPINIPTGCDVILNLNYQYGGGKDSRAYDLARIQWTMTPSGNNGNFYGTDTNGPEFCLNEGVRTGDTVQFYGSGLPAWGGFGSPSMYSAVYSAAENSPPYTFVGDTPLFLIDQQILDTGTGYIYRSPIIDSRDLSNIKTYSGPYGGDIESCDRNGVLENGATNNWHIDNRIAVQGTPSGGWKFGALSAIAVYQGIDGSDHKWDAYIIAWQKSDINENYQIVWKKRGIVGTANGFTVTTDSGDGSGTFYDMKEPFYTGQSFLCGILDSGPDDSGCGDCYGTGWESCDELTPESPEWYECYDCWSFCMDTYYTVTPPTVSMTVNRLEPDIPLWVS